MSTLVYRYGLLPPTLNGDVVDEQMRAGHRYYNQLIEIERWRRQEYRSAVGDYDEIECLDAWRTALVDDLEAARDAVKSQRKATRSRSDTAAQREACNELRVELREVSALLKATKLALREDAALRARAEEINQEATGRVRATRAVCGCYWGTYLLAEAAADAARKTAQVEPHFRRWDGAGVIGVQLQGGLPAADAFGCGDTRLQIDTRLQPVPGRTGKARPRVRLRVGSDGRAPVWAEWPLILHRPLPDGSVAQWAKVKRERLGGRDRWSLHLTITVPASGRRADDCSQAVAIDLGWRKRENGLRVAYLLGDDGESREVLLGEDVLRGLHQVDDLRAIRDQHLNTARTALASWLHDAGSIPEWLSMATEHLAQWRSPARFAALAVAWREHREGQSEEVERQYQALEAWRKKDKHLWTWECNLRDKVLARRREQYRVLAARLVDRYHVLVLERFDLRSTQRHQAPEVETPEIQPARAQQRIAATSILRECLIQAFARRGGVVAELPSRWTTRACPRCGVIDEAWDPAESVEHRCSACGALSDQDEAACHNLLKAWRERSSDAPGEGGARVTDHGAPTEESASRKSRWGRLGRHKANRSQDSAQVREDVGGLA